MPIAHTPVFCYSWDIYSVFRPAGATSFTDGVKFGVEESTKSRILLANLYFTPSVQRWPVGGSKFRNINAPQGRIAWAIFTKISEFVGSFMVG